MAVKVEYEYDANYGYGIPQSVARVEIGTLGITGEGTTFEEARQDLLHRVRMHQAAVEATIRTVEQSVPPQDG